MKKFYTIHFLLMLSLVWIASAPVTKVLKIGEKAPMTNHQVEDVSGKKLSLSSVAGENGLMVIFTCNTCPWVAKWEDRYNQIAQIASEKGIGVISLNPNEEIRDAGESMEDMAARAKKMKYEFYYAMDTDHKLADAFGATRTPEIFIFDKELTLVYNGAIDDNANSAADVKETYVANALNELAAGKTITKSTTKSLGCTIKRVS